VKLYVNNKKVLLGVCIAGYGEVRQRKWWVVP